VFNVLYFFVDWGLKVCKGEYKTIERNTERGISQLTENADNECKNEAKAQIVTC
jgi:hypothetical protein